MAEQTIDRKITQQDVEEMKARESSEIEPAEEVQVEYLNSRQTEVKEKDLQEVADIYRRLDSAISVALSTSPAQDDRAFSSEFGQPNKEKS